MKKFFIGLLTTLCIVCSLFVFVSCRGSGNGGGQAEPKYKITFDANGGTGESGFIELKNGEIGKLPKNLFVKDDYVFVGWATEQNGAVEYADVAQIIGTDQDITLYAVWEKESVFAVDGNTLKGLTEYGKEKLTQISIPSRIDGNEITSIGDFAFENCNDLTSIVIPESVTSIGSSAFSGCSGLTSIAVPESVTSIGNAAFENCSSLTSITIPNNVTWIGNSAFFGCSNLTSITIGDSVTIIGWSAFEGCTSLANITLPDSVTRIGGSAFKDCNGLTSVRIANIESWCNIQFVGDESNPLSYAHNLYLNDVLVTDLIIPNSGVTSIEKGVFAKCSNLVSVTIGNSVASIGESAFFGCNKLKSVTIGNSVARIGSGAFSNCGSLKSVAIPDSVTYIGDAAFFGCDQLQKVYHGGTEAQWRAIIVGIDDNPLLNATRYQYSEKQPTAAGNYWHYVNGKVVEW